MAVAARRNFPLSETSLDSVRVINKSNQRQIHSGRFGSSPHFLGLRTVGKQSVTIERHPLPGVLTCMGSQPLHFTPTVRRRNGRDAPVLGWFGWWLRLLLLVCQQVSQPALFSRRQLGYLCENVLNSNVEHRVAFLPGQRRGYRSA